MFTDWPFSLASLGDRAHPARPVRTPVREHRCAAACPAAQGRLPRGLVHKALTGMLKRDEKVDFSHPSASSELAYSHRMEAISGLAFLRGDSDPELVNQLVTIVEDPDDDARLGVAAGVALTEMADATMLATLLAKILDCNAPERARIAFLNGLWRKPSAELSPQLLPLLGGEITSGAIKLLAALAIGYSANSANDEELLGLLDDRHARRFAAIAVMLGGDEAGARRLLEILPSDRYAEEVVRATIDSSQDDKCSLLRESMFSSDQIYRRMRVAEILKDGKCISPVSYDYAWRRLTGLLAAGSDAPGGMSRRAIRAELYRALIGHDPERRRLVAAVLVGMRARGLLLAARDVGIQEAREALRRLDESQARGPQMDEQPTLSADSSVPSPMLRTRHRIQGTRR